MRILYYTSQPLINKYVNMVFNVHRNHKAYQLGRGEGGMEVGRGRASEREIIHIATVTTRMIPALRWAAMRAILMFHDCDGQSHKTVSVHKPQLLKRKESQSGIEQRSLPLTSLPPYC